MSTDDTNGAVAALILIPIAIAGSAAFIAVKSTNLWKVAVRRFRGASAPFPWHTQKHQRRLSDQSSSYADSFLDLESLASNQSKFEDRYNRRPRAPNTSPAETWHPSRQARLQWSFTSPQSQDPNHFVSSSIPRPTRTHTRPERSQSQESPQHQEYPQFQGYPQAVRI